MTKTLNQIIFYPPPKSEYFFQQHWESEYFFRKNPQNVVIMLYKGLINDVFMFLQVYLFIYLYFDYCFTMFL